MRRADCDLDRDRAVSPGKARQSFPYRLRFVGPSLGLRRRAAQLLRHDGDQFLRDRIELLRADAAALFGEADQ